MEQTSNFIFGSLPSGLKREKLSHLFFFFFFFSLWPVRFSSATFVWPFFTPFEQEMTILPSYLGEVLCVNNGFILFIYILTLLGDFIHGPVFSFVFLCFFFCMQVSLSCFPYQDAPICVKEWRMGFLSMDFGYLISWFYPSSPVKLHIEICWRGEKRWRKVGEPHIGKVKRKRAAYNLAGARAKLPSSILEKSTTIRPFN